MLFQFQYGAIGSNLFQKLNNVLSNWFQFQYGAIGSSKLASLSFEAELFQFQYGAIGSCFSARQTYFFTLVSIPVWCDWENVYECVLINNQVVSIPVWCDWECYLNLQARMSHLFQFQYGAIGSVEYADSGSTRCGFNSSMVRLGEILNSLNQSEKTSFNSSMVRLGATHSRLTNSLRMFQFQYGAIGSNFGNRPDLTTHCFNSSMVRLGAGSGGQKIFFQNGFNSSMVRLGVYATSPPRRAFGGFQFQYGAIGS